MENLERGLQWKRTKARLTKANLSWSLTGPKAIASWSFGDREKDLVQALARKLRYRSVLDQNMWEEIRGYTITSVHEIQQEIVAVIAQTGYDTPAGSALDVLARTCVEFKHSMDPQENSNFVRLTDEREIAELLELRRVFRAVWARIGLVGDISEARDLYESIPVEPPRPWSEAG